MTIRTLPITLTIAVLLASPGARAEAPESASQYAPAGWQVGESPVQARGTPKNRVRNPQSDRSRNPQDDPNYVPGDEKLSQKKLVRVQNLRRDGVTADAVGEDDNLGAVLRIEQSRARVLTTRQKAGQDTSDEVVEEEVRVRENIRKNVKVGMEGTGLTGEEREREIEARVEGDLAHRRREAQKVFSVSKNSSPSDLQVLNMINTSLQKVLSGKPPSFTRIRRMAADRKEEADLKEVQKEAKPIKLKIKQNPLKQEAGEGEATAANASAPAPAPKKPTVEERRSKLKKTMQKHERLLQLNEQERLPTGNDYDAQISRLERQALAQRLKLKPAKAALQRLPAAPVRQQADEAKPDEAQ